MICQYCGRLATREERALGWPAVDASLCTICPTCWGSGAYDPEGRLLRPEEVRPVAGLRLVSTWEEER